MPAMDETTQARGRRGGGREARRAARLHEVAEKVPFITRTLKPVEILAEEGLATIEENADTILETVGIEFREAPDAHRLLADAGCDVDGERVRFPRGLARRLIQATAPREFDQYSRSPATTVHLGGDATVLAPAYGSPFVRDLDGGRRYGTIEDFRNFVKLAYMTPFLHHSGERVCEPVDLPVNKRHYDMVYAHMRYSDKPFMGSVTHPLRARDTVDMARIVFGADALEERPYVMSLINANSPLVWDSTMLGAARAYAEANQAVIMTPFILAGAMSPATAAGAATQTLAEAMAGMATCSSSEPAPRWSSARSHRRCRCSRARRRSGRPSPRSCSTRSRRAHAGSASRSAAAGRSRRARSPTPRPRTRAPTRCSRPSSAASISCSTRQVGSRAASRWATRNSCSTSTSVDRCTRSPRGWTCPRTARRSNRSSRTGPGSTSSVRRTHSPTSRAPSTGRASRTPPLSSSGSSTGRSTRTCGRT